AAGMINPPDKSEPQNQANENHVDSKFTPDALGDPIWFYATKIVPKTQRLSKVFPLLHLLPFTAFHKVG
ncbi:MAG: hypothetical protein QMB34_09675, partial [Paracoccaceae bacterium]